MRQEMPAEGPLRPKGAAVRAAPGSCSSVSKKGLGSAIPPSWARPCNGWPSRTRSSPPQKTWDLLLDALWDGWESIDRRLEASGPLRPDRFALREAIERVAVHYGCGRRGR